MNNTTKYVLYLLLVVVVIALLFYLRDNISFWMSRVGTYVVILGVTFAAGWIMGRMGGCNKYKERISQMQQRIDDLEKNKKA